jgi:hypothetical protein
MNSGATLLFAVLAVVAIVGLGGDLAGSAHAQTQLAHQPAVTLAAQVAAESAPRP